VKVLKVILEEVGIVACTDAQERAIHWAALGGGHGGRKLRTNPLMVSTTQDATLSGVGRLFQFLGKLPYTSMSLGIRS